MSETKKMIMIVDDDPNIIRSLTFVLNKEGYNIVTANDGEEAMEKIRVSKPNLMLLDVMMPRKNGYEVCQEVKCNPDLSDIYIIILSAKGQETDREHGLSLGANEFITKPFSPMKIAERVKQLLK